MIAVIQRVRSASVRIENETVGSIGQGLLVLLGIGTADTEKQAEWLARKVAQLRIFSDAEGRMNLSVTDVSGQILVVSQFTLLADASHGNRPSYTRAARPEQAVPLYEGFCSAIARQAQTNVQKGVFGADMQVHLINDGPVTIVLDTEQIMPGYLRTS